MAKRLLMQFAKMPVAGQVKTRMQALLSPEQACDLHCQLMRWTANTLIAAQLAPAELWLAGQGEHPLVADLQALGMSIHRQSGDDLGQRMAAALSQGLQRADQVVLVGSDCPAINQAYLEQAFAALHERDVVLGPAQDGGYVLIGCRQRVPDMFSNVPWGTADVLSASRSQLHAAGVSYSELATLPDIDRPEDLPHWQALQQARQ